MPVDQPFQAHIEIALPAGTEGQNGFVTVPADRRLVIDYVSGEGFVPSGQKCVFSVITSLNGAASGTTHYLRSVQMGPFGGKDLSQTGELVRLYADPGTTVMLRADRDAPAGDGLARMTLSGHLIPA
jgi:hypothetical protein